MDKNKQKQILIDIMNDDAKNGLYKTKPFNIALVRDIMDMHDFDEISFSRMVEMLNKMAIEWHEKQINKKCKQQTALDWFVKEIQTKLNTIGEVNYVELVKEAKVIEKAQIIDSFTHGFYQNVNQDYNTPEEYYNETYE